MVLTREVKTDKAICKLLEESVESAEKHSYIGANKKIQEAKKLYKKIGYNYDLESKINESIFKIGDIIIKRL